MLKKIVLICIVFIGLLFSNILSVQAATTRPLNNLVAGSTVYYGGKAWILLDPAQQLLMQKTAEGPIYYDYNTSANKYYDPNDISNIANYLNTMYLNSLINNDWIANTSWTRKTIFRDMDTGVVLSSTNIAPITAKIGLPSRDMMMNYQSLIVPTDFNNSYWGIDYVNDTGGTDKGAMIFYDTMFNRSDSNLANNHYFRPVIYLTPGAKVDLLDNIIYSSPPEITLSTTSNQTISASGSVTLSGVITDPDNDNVTISAVINGVTKTVTVNSAPATNPGVNNWSLTWNASELAQGSYTNITITANDSRITASVTYNATITVDNIAPVVNITAPTSGSYNVIPLLFFTSNEGLVVVRVDGAIVPITSGQSLGAITDGTHTVTVTSTDAAGNQTTASVTFNVDRVAPTVSLSSILGGATNDNTPQINYIVSDGSVVVKVDGTVVPKVSGQSLDTLADGSHTITVESTDAAGNKGTASTTFTVDCTAPVINITSPTSGAINAVPTLNYTVSEGTPVVKLDGNTISITAGQSLGALLDGVHTISVTSNDAAGNQATSSVTFTLDRQAPTVSLVAIPGGVTTSKTPQINYTVSDGTTVVKVDGSVVTKASGDNLDTLSEGSHTVTVESTDAAGNLGTASITFTVDSIVPTVNITNPVNNGSFTGSPLFVYVASEGLVTVKLDGVVTPLVSGNPLSGISDGVHTIYIEARDSAGNIGTATTSFTVDSTAPQITLVPPPGNSTSDNTPLLNYTVSDGAVVVKVDGRVVSKVTGESLETLTEGSHTVTVEATDAAGNLGTASITFTVDSTSPTIGITSPLNGSVIVDDTPQLMYSVSEGTSIVRVDGTIVNKLSGQSLNSLVDGPHTIIIEATDAAGNRGSVSSTFTVDRGAPMVFITSPLNGTLIKDKTPQINYNVSDGNVTVKVDGSLVTKVSGDYLETLTEGIHTLRVESRDSAGNIGSAQVSFTVDSTAPNVNITSPANGTIILENTPIISFFNSDGTAVVKLDGTVVSKVSGQKLDTLSNGSHTITVTATDTAGNTGSASSTFTVNAPIPGQTTFGPTVKIISPANEAVTNNRNPQINYTVSEGTVTVKIDGQITNKTSGQALDALSDGYHTVRVEAVDSKGQIGAAQVIFKVDLTGPTINITSPITGSTIYETKPKVTYTISDGTAVVKVDGTVVSKTSGQNLDNLSLGLHTLTVEATDSAGNTSVEQATYTVSSQTSEVPAAGIPDSSTQVPSYSAKTPDNFKYQFDPFSENTNVAGIEAAPMTEQERDMYFNSQANGQEGPLKVTVSPLGGTYENPQVVNLAVNKPAIIYYTTNGSNPTTESDMFSAPILVDQSMTIRYFAKDGDGKTTPIQSQKYIIKNSTKSQGLAMKSQQKTSGSQDLQLKKKAQDGEIDSSLILTALGWVMLTTAVGSILTLKG